MSQQRFLQQLRSSVQSNKEAAINAVKSQLGTANDGSFVLGRYYDGDNGVRTVIGVNARVGVGKTMTIYEFDSIAQEILTNRLVEVEGALGIGQNGGGSSSTTTIVGRVELIEETLKNLTSEDKNNTKSIEYKIDRAKQELIGDKYQDTAESNTIEGAKKYADKAIEKELSETGGADGKGGLIYKAIETAKAAATTKVIEGEDSQDNLLIQEIVNTDNSTTYEIHLQNIATADELEEVKEFLGLSEDTTGETVTIIDRIVEVNDRITTEVNTLNQSIQANTDAITVLNGTGEGSVHKTVADEISKVLDGAPEQFDTLKEIADYIANDVTNASQMVTDINDLKSSVNALNNLTVDACSDSTLIKVTPSTKVNDDGKVEKTFTVCPNGIASVSELELAKETLNNSIGEVKTQLNLETSERKRVDKEIQALVEAEAANRVAEDAKIQTQLNIITGETSTNSIQSQISNLKNEIVSDATRNGSTLGLLEDRIELLESDVNGSNGKVNQEINTAIQNINYEDTALSNHYVSSVKQESGKIHVTRQQFINAIVTPDSKTLGQKFDLIDASIASAEASAKAAATRIELSGNDMLTQTSIVDANGATTYNLNLSDTWDCGTFTYGGEDVDTEEDVQQPE